MTITLTFARRGKQFAAVVSSLAEASDKEAQLKNEGWDLIDVSVEYKD